MWDAGEFSRIFVLKVNLHSVRLLLAVSYKKIGGAGCTTCFPNNFVGGVTALPAAPVPTPMWSVVTEASTLVVEERLWLKQNRYHPCEMSNCLIVEASYKLLAKLLLLEHSQWRLINLQLLYSFCLTDLLSMIFMGFHFSGSVYKCWLCKVLSDSLLAIRNVVPYLHLSDEIS